MKAPGVRFYERSRRVKFRYVNWRGQEHEYVILVEGIEFGPYDSKGGSPDRVLRDKWTWVLHGDVVTRDGDDRPEMEPTRRRTFLLDGIRDLEEM